MEITVEKDKVTGAYHLSAIVGTQYIRRTYFGYSKKDCLRMFKKAAARLANA